MKLSTSHGLQYHIPGTNNHYTPTESLSALKTAGYDSVDINLWGLCSPGGPLALDTWEATVEEYCAASEGVGLPVFQTHGNTMSGTQWDDPSYPHRELQHITTLRCVEAARRLHADCIVLHPFNLSRITLYSTSENKKACIAYLSPYIEAAKKAGVRVAVENMIDFGRRHRRYCAGDIYELIDLVETIHDPAVGICVDTGHANISGMNAGDTIRAAGKHLMALHINDNHSKLGEDEHLLPYFGDVDWSNVMRALTEVKYSGHLTYEIRAQDIPHEARPAWLAYTVQIGRHLISLTEQ